MTHFTKLPSGVGYDETEDLDRTKELVIGYRVSSQRQQDSHADFWGPDVSSWKELAPSRFYKKANFQEPGTFATYKTVAKYYMNNFLRSRARTKYKAKWERDIRSSDLLRLQVTPVVASFIHNESSGDLSEIKPNIRTQRPSIIYDWMPADYLTATRCKEYVESLSDQVPLLLQQALFNKFYYEPSYSVPPEKLEEYIDKTFLAVRCYHNLLTISKQESVLEVMLTDKFFNETLISFYKDGDYEPFKKADPKPEVKPKDDPPKSEDFDLLEKTILHRIEKMKDELRNMTSDIVVELRQAKKQQLKQSDNP